MVAPIAQLGEDVLNQVAVPVAQFDHQLVQLSERMMAAMIAANGVGIAAPQIHVSQRVVIIASRPSERYPDAPSMDPIVLVNPEIIDQSEHTELGWEGCLSVPGIRGQVARATKVSVSYQNLQGQQHQLELEGFAARIAQHELDHLNGFTFVDRVETNKRLVSTSVWERQCRA